MGARQKLSLRSLLHFAVERGLWPVLLRKVLRRFESGGSLSAEENQAWLYKHAEDPGAFAAAIDREGWAEALRIAEELEVRAKKKLSEIPTTMGGGGLYPLLYFLVRKNSPATVVETGVAAGYSSQAVLAAMEANGTGHLYSSDLPYFRVENAEKYIGVLVAEELKPRWSLFLEGDERNLARINAEAPSIDLFHYDSDKSYTGRVRAWASVRGKLNPEAVVLWDDVQDNAHFHDWIERERPSMWRVFRFGGKYVGYAERR